MAVPLDLLVSTYRLPQIARLDSGESPPANRSLGWAVRACAGEGGTRWGVGCPPPPALDLARAAAAALARRSQLSPAARDVKIRALAGYLKRTPPPLPKINIRETSADSNLGGELSLSTRLQELLNLRNPEELA